MLYSQLIERLNDEEVLAVVAHEVGHIHAEHVLYLTAARLIEFLAKSAVLASPLTFIVKEILTMSMRAALLAWARRAELSCDRAALLVTQDANVIGRTMMKLSGGTFASRVDYDQFLGPGARLSKELRRESSGSFLGRCDHFRLEPSVSCLARLGDSAVGRERRVQRRS